MPYGYGISTSSWSGEATSARSLFWLIWIATGVCRRVPERAKDYDKERFGETPVESAMVRSARQLGDDLLVDTWWT